MKNFFKKLALILFFVSNLGASERLVAFSIEAIIELIIKGEIGQYDLESLKLSEPMKTLTEAIFESNKNLDAAYLRIYSNLDLYPNQKQALLDLLEACGADVKYVFNFWNSPIVSECDRYIQKIFIQCLSEPELSTRDIKLLIDLGIDINAKHYKDFGVTGLMVAAKYNKLEFVNLLIKYGANLNLQDNEGKTALMYAAEEGSVDSLKMLVYSGACLNIKDNKGDSVFDICKKNPKKLLYKLEKSNRAKNNEILDFLNNVVEDESRQCFIQCMQLIAKAKLKDYGI